MNCIHRKIMVYESTYQRNEGERNDGVKAVFHVWGINCIEFETGGGNYSTAIVEYENGNVSNVPVECIKFVEPPVECIKFVEPTVTANHE